MQLLLLYKKSTGNKKHCHYHKALAKKILDPYFTAILEPFTIANSNAAEFHS